MWFLFIPFLGITFAVTCVIHIPGFICHIFISKQIVQCSCWIYKTTTIACQLNYGVYIWTSRLWKGAPKFITINNISYHFIVGWCNSYIRVVKFFQVCIILSSHVCVSVWESTDLLQSCVVSATATEDEMKCSRLKFMIECIVLFLVVICICMFVILCEE